MMLTQAMTQPSLQNARSRLSLTSSLPELAKVSPWISELATGYNIPAETRFAIELCLEEALSNIVRHGYRGEPGHPMTIDCALGDACLLFVVEDHAPPFEPAKPGEVEIQHLNTITPGGQGIRLLHRFAGSVDYERLADGNRLTLGFPLPERNA
jgi:anti-sigma regulatory factor (Ser/Thr protein kinase)